MNYTSSFLPNMVYWKWIDRASPEQLEKHLKSPKIDTTTLLGHGALRRYTNNKLSTSVELCSKFIDYLPEEKYSELNLIFDEKEKENLFPRLLNGSIEKRQDTKSKNLLNNLQIFTPKQFHAACTRKLYHTVEHMLRRGANPNQPNSTETSTILHYAVAHGDERLVDLLLSFDANLNEQDENGYTPMHWALATDNLSLLEKLYTKGADVTIANNDGESLVTMALKYNKTSLREIAAYLFKDFPHIYYLIQDEPMDRVIETIKSDPQKYILENDIGANPLEVPALLHDPELAHFVKKRLTHDKFESHFAVIENKYPYFAQKIASQP